MNNQTPTTPRRMATPGRVAIAALLMACVAAICPARHHHSGAQSASEAGHFDYYVLSLSWAPTYCLTHSDDGDECSGKGYGFVLHGLWPQYEVGGYPEHCASQFELSAPALIKGRTIYPSERLMQHEWREHGTCSGLEALAYFQAADRAMAVMKMPPALEAPREERSLTADQIENLFKSANPEMPAGAMTVACSRDSFSEVRVCLTRDLLIRSCGRRVRSSCPRVPLQIPASR